MTGSIVRVAAFVLALILSAAPLLAAEWVEVPGKRTWDRAQVHFCKHADQCLVDANGDTANDNQTLKYFTGIKKPKCITHGQYIKGWYCGQGNWTTRARPLAMFLMDYAGNIAPDDFAVFCGTYDEALNYVTYATFESLSNYFDPAKCSSVPSGQTAIREPNINCNNEVCVLRAGSKVAVGTTLNVPLTHPRSFLRALNLSTDTCDAVAASVGGNFSPCTDGRVWYSPGLHAIIYAPDASIPSGDPLAIFTARLGAAWNAVRGYIIGRFASGIGLEQHRDFTLYNATPPQYLKLYAAKKGSKEVLAFWDSTQDPTAPAGIKDYLGVRYTGLSLGTDPCGAYITVYDPKAHCTVESGVLFVASRRVTGEPGASRPTPLNRAFNDLGAKLRMT